MRKYIKKKKEKQYDNLAKTIVLITLIVEIVYLFIVKFQTVCDITVIFL